MLALSNSQSLIPFEAIHGTIAGVDFGSNVFVIARSAAAMLLWCGGYSWSLNGHSRYSASHLTLITNRNVPHLWRDYSRVGKQEGGRLTVTRVESTRDAIEPKFGAEHWGAIIEAVKARQTLLIEGGGEEPQPSYKRGRDAYLDWRSRIEACPI